MLRRALSLGACTRQSVVLARQTAVALRQVLPSLLLMLSPSLSFATSFATSAAASPLYFDCFLEVDAKVTAVYRIALDEPHGQAFLQQEGGLFYHIEEVSFSPGGIEIVIGEYLKRRFIIERASLKFSHEIEHNQGVHRSEGECWPMEMSERV